ncbi:HyaD/HybD family hydrogenase maturation endopeptidase [Phaeovulum vinaykumarii]|uniref:HyaD/HybD family hydrogenase maturation endopeptidase n=1 Tax=Phaeovulum vinaykumarii TaxID=407234 RepID=UPI00097099EC|nr:HyaD/HybD family hydrogenase maturation endopeptidase [Phaeovulum vinaykumarii]
MLVLGIGNLLWADEGFGPRALEALAGQYAFPDHVRLLDGGTQGMYLLPFLEEADALLILDAVDFGLPPGKLVVRRDAEVPAFLGAKKMSLHQTGFQEVLATADLLGRLPRRITLIGCQPEELEDYGGGLRASVAARIPEAISAVLSELADWGVQAEPGRSDGAELADPAIRRAAYEDGRPPAETACRLGDDRFFPSAGADDVRG